MINIVLLALFWALGSPHLSIWARRSVPGVLTVDVSYFQNPVNDSYRRPWLIFRGAFGNWIDPDFDTNYAWAAAHANRRSWRTGFRKLRGFTAYVVFQPGQDAVGALCKHIVDKFGSISPYMCIEIDVESWSGTSYAINGDHSAELNQQVARGVSALNANRKRVWAYFNASDGAAIWPNRPALLRVILAAYTSVRPNLSGPGVLFGWQYTDGTTRWPHPADLPISTPPFGNVDHDVLLDTNPQNLAADVFGKPSPKPPAHRPKPVNHPRQTKVITVHQGDTLGSLAKLHTHGSIRDLELLNLRRHPHLQEHPDFIQVGWKIRVPK